MKALRTLGFGFLGVALVAAAIVLGLRLGNPKRSVEVGRLEVGIRNFRFEPSVIEVAPGDTVVWTNYDFVPHTVTAPDGAWDSGTITTGNSWTVVAGPNIPTTYICTFHPNMTGSVVLLGRRSRPTGG